MTLDVWVPGPGLGPAADSLSFASPKESKQRKGDPAVCVPSLRYGQPAVLDVDGGPQNSLRSNSCGPDPVYVCAPRRSQKGWGNPAGLRCARPPNIQQPIPSRAKQRPVPSPLPSGCAEERSVSRIRARPCLSEASLGETPRNASTTGCPFATRRGRRQWGRLFFGYFLLAKQKKVARPPGRVPASESKPTQRPAKC